MVCPTSIMSKIQRYGGLLASLTRDDSSLVKYKYCTLIEFERRDFACFITRTNESGFETKSYDTGPNIQRRFGRLHQ